MHAFEKITLASETQSDPIVAFTKSGIDRSRMGQSFPRYLRDAFDSGGHGR
jgi:hypothetical protein